MSDIELKQTAAAAKSRRLDDKLEVMVIDGTQTRPVSSAPLDRYKLVFFVLLIHGIGTLMPWNMFINAEAYFRDYKLTPPRNNYSIVDGPHFQNESSSSANANANATLVDQRQLEDLRKNFLSYLSLASQLPNVIFNGLNLIVNMGSGNLKLRVNLTLAVEAIIFGLTITLAIVDSSQWTTLFFILTMISVIVLNMASGIYQNCIFGFGAKFPGSYTNAILIGSNLSGTFTSSMNLLSIWLAPEPQEAAIYYFITALFVILVCLISYNLLKFNRFFNHFERSGGSSNDQNVSTNESDLFLTTTSKRSDDVPETLRNTVDAMVPRPEQKDENSFMGELTKKWQVLKKCWPQCLNVFLTFYVTLALFPAVMANIGQSQNSYFSKKYFTSFACFFVFNLFAMIGNLISGWTTWPGKNRVWIMVVARFIFVPFFLFCNFNPATRHWPVLINNEIIFIIGNIVLALSSGYLSSLCMMFASSDLKPEDASKAGMLAAFFLVFGIFIGVNSSFLLTWIVELG